jgi:hypothetical protein
MVYNSNPSKNYLGDVSCLSLLETQMCMCKPSQASDLMGSTRHPTAARWQIGPADDLALRLSEAQSGIYRSITCPAWVPACFPRAFLTSPAATRSGAGTRSAVRDNTAAPNPDWRQGAGSDLGCTRYRLI